METFEPLINLFVLMTALSVVAERITNHLKLGNEDLRRRTDDDRTREQRIQNRSVIVGIGLALLMKADMFLILSNLDDPWKTLGWIRVTGGHAFRSEAAVALGPCLMAVVGCVITGFALGFGSRFWHDVLGSLLDVRKRGRNARRAENRQAQSNAHDDANNNVTDAAEASNDG